MSGNDPWWIRHSWLVIAAVVLIAYWPLSTFSFTLSQADALNCWLPWRHFIAQSLQDGSFPAWNPYQQMGYPIHADLQGPAWYVETLALGGTIGQGVCTLQALFLIYVIIGGCGFRRFVLDLHGDPTAALIAGIAYALGGFFTAHAMHFFSVISGAWLPWMLGSWLRMLDAPKARHALRTSVFLFLLLTGGNHTFTIIAAYLMAILFVARLWRLWRSGVRDEMRRLIVHSFIVIGATALMACGTLYSAWEVAPFLDRAGGLPYDKASAHPFTLASFISFFFPYASSADPERMGTDPTMSNAYVGAIMLALAALSLLRIRSPRENLLLAFGALCMMIAMADTWPVYRSAHAVLPGIDLFRFPSYFTWFTSFALLVLASGTVPQCLGIVRERPRAVAVLLGAVTLPLIYLWSRSTVHMLGTLPSLFREHDGLFARMNAPGYDERIVLQGLFTLPAFCLFMILLRRGRDLRPWLPLLIAAEMIGAVMLGQWTTTLGNVRPGELQARIDAQPQDPVIPELHPMGRDRDGGIAVRPLWLNTQDFTGRPTHDGFNSFWLNTTNELETQHPDLLEAMKRQPLIYLTGRVIAGSAFDRMKVDPDRDSDLVVIAEDRPVPALHRSPGDRIALLDFDHQGLTAAVSCSGPVFLMLQQAWFPGWAVRVDGSPVEPMRANIAGFGVVVPAGERIVQIRYHRPVLRWLLLASYGTFFTVLLVLAFGGDHRVRDPIGIAVLAGTLAWSLLAHRPKGERMRDQVIRIAEKLDGTHDRSTIVVNTDRPRAVDAWIGHRPHLAVRTDQADAVDRVEASITGSPAGPLTWIEAGLPTPSAVHAFLLDRFPRVEEIHRSRDVRMIQLIRSGDPITQTVLYQGPQEPGQALSTRGVPYTAAFRISARELMAHPGAWLSVDVKCRLQGAPKAFIVIERKKGERTTDYEAFPLAFVNDSTDRWHAAYAVQPLALLHDPDEEVGAYVWNDSPDTLLVRDLRVRIVERDLSSW